MDTKRKKRVDLGEPSNYVAKLATKNHVYEVADSAVVGLRVVVQTTGFKSWAVRYVFKGRTRKFTLGPFPRIRLRDARKLASTALLRVHAGGDPAKEKADEIKRAKSDTVALAFAKYEDEYLKGKKSAPETKRIFKRHVLPKWKARALLSISKSDVIELLKSIGAPIMANRVYSALSKFFRWCSARDLITAAPTIGVGKLHQESKSRDRTLSDLEIRWFWQGCGKIGFPFGPMFRQLLITGCRRNDAAAMKIEELDRNANLWTLEGPRTKTGNAHKIYIAPMFEAILDSLSTENDFMFGRKKPPSGFSKAKKALDKEITEKAKDEFEGVPAPWRLHDLRRTFRSGLARLGVATEVAERCIAHSSGPSFEGVKGTYNVFGYPDEMQAAFQKWSDHVAKIVR